MKENKYLYEIIEGYKETTSSEEKDELFNEFCSALWQSKNKRRIYVKTIKFKVRDDLLNTNAGKIFDAWSIIEYNGYKAMSVDNNWYDLIRQKINNLYTRYFDVDIILNKQYMDLLKTPKNLYYRWTKGYDIDVDNLENIIDEAISNAQIIKESYQKQKMQLSWNEYKNLVEKLLRKIFDSCITINEYEKKHGILNYLLLNEFSTEDNFYIKYICKSLDSHMRNYQKQYYEIKRGRNKKYKRCKECGKLIEKTNNRTMYCKSCYKKINESDAVNRMRKYRKIKKEKCVTF